MKNHLKSLENFHGIQYLRAIAAIMVVVHHARYFFDDISGWIGFGATGVDIFFVISGFIMVHATRNFDTQGQKVRQATDFLLKRAIRVIPLYWIALLYQNKRALVERNVDAGLVLDFFFIPRFSTWAPAQIWPSLVPGWTINYEMLFYFLFGVALFFGSRRYVVLVTAIAALMAAGWLVNFQNPALIFWTSGILGEFLFGMLVYGLIKRHSIFPPLYAVLAVALAGTAGLIYGIPHLPRAIANGPFAAMVVWSGVHLGRIVREQKWLLKIGDASYSIYLSHQFTFALSGRALHILGINEPTHLNIAAVLISETLTAIAIGMFLHYLVEKPLLNSLNSLWRSASQRTTPKIRPT